MSFSDLVLRLSFSAAATRLAAAAEPDDVPVVRGKKQKKQGVKMRTGKRPDSLNVTLGRKKAKTTGHGKPSKRHRTTSGIEMSEG